MVYILSSDPARTIMVARRRQKGSGRRRQRGSGRRQRQRGGRRRRQRGGRRRRQRGHGVIDVIKGIAGHVLPYAKKAGKYILREGIKKAPGLITSDKKGAFLRNAVKETAQQGVKQIISKLDPKPKPKKKYRRAGRTGVI